MRKSNKILLGRTDPYVNPLLLPADAHNVKKRRVIKTF